MKLFWILVVIGFLMIGATMMRTGTDGEADGERVQRAGSGEPMRAGAAQPR